MVSASENDAARIVLEVRELAKSFGRQRVLRNIRFRIRRGEVAGIVGENGSGKTTLLKIIVRLLRPNSGTIDAGWLQNPIDYADAQNKAIIRHLPAYFPSQLSMASAFTEHSVIPSLLGGLAYGSILLLAAMAIFWRRMRIRK